MAGERDITPEQAEALVRDGAQLIDVREDEEWEAGRIGGARHVVLGEVASQAPTIDQERLDAVRSPFRTAERFGVEEIIDPRETRPLLCAWARRAHEIVAHEAGGGPKARGPRP